MKQKFKRVIPDFINVNDLTPLDITCGATKCNDGLHCFCLSKSAIRKFGKKGVCKECGVNLINWDRVHKNKIKDAAFTFESLKNELIRHVFWHTKIPKETIEFAKDRGVKMIRENAKKILKQRVGKYIQFIDGRQTPMTGKEIINYAQHATATCCRKCLNAWHGIEIKKDLTLEELEYCTDLVMLYIKDKLKL